jgi:hypothetical protein
VVDITLTELRPTAAGTAKLYKVEVTRGQPPVGVVAQGEPFPDNPPPAPAPVPQGNVGSVDPDVDLFS